ncbi:membrane protein [Amycolatopsis deserti]|uniref:Membrane protein n=1 Tax=Amycolatopsis deserti TaxID=185696 RepID=A0ABQ3JAK4_9PSEU|nr:DoxX family protein [Amycolatopsis deserti]GHF16185.1 membrane protein [Amycolatopsis deserti]
MEAIRVIVVGLTIVLNAGIAAADFARAEFVLANSAAVDVPPSWLPFLGTLKAAGAAGLLLGLLGVEWLGIAAAAGLVLFYLGALAAHVRARELGTMYFPGLFFALAVGSLELR